MWWFGIWVTSRGLGLQVPRVFDFGFRLLGGTWLWRTWCDVDLTDSFIVCNNKSNDMELRMVMLV